MPNATVRASAPALPASRRTILRSILAVGAVGAIPAAAEPASAPADLDAALFALVAVARDLAAQSKAALDLLITAVSLSEVPPPKVLLAREADAQYWRIKIGELIEKESIDAVKRLRALVREVEAQDDQLASYAFPCKSPLFPRGLDERIAELDAARAQWAAEREAAIVRSGEREAEARYDKARDAECDMLDRVAETAAQTMAGILGKLGLVAPHFAGADPDWGAAAEAAVLASVARDFVRLRGTETGAAA